MGKPGKDINLTVEMSFIESVFGATKTLKFDRQEVCKKCKGQGVTKPKR